MAGQVELFEFTILYNRSPNHYGTYICTAPDFNEAKAKFLGDFSDPNSPPTIVSITKGSKIK
jgi:hypothetical protein